MFRKFLLMFCLGTSILSYAGSVRLVNDSPFTLTATILGADGTELFHGSLTPQAVYQWQQEADPFSNLNYEILTPYTVIWSCEDGSEFGLWTNVQQAALVAAQESPAGNKVCKIQKRNQQEPRPR